MFADLIKTLPYEIDYLQRLLDYKKQLRSQPWNYKKQRKLIYLNREIYRLQTKYFIYGHNLQN